MATAAQRLATGRYGERSAAQWLARQGMVLIDRNWRCELGELDLVLRDGDVLVVCEVKTRSGTRYGEPAEAVTRRKARRIRRVARAWLAAHHVRWCEVRFDVVAVLAEPGRPVTVQHYEAAF